MAIRNPIPLTEKCCGWQLHCLSLAFFGQEKLLSHLTQHLMKVLILVLVMWQSIAFATPSTSLLEELCPLTAILSYIVERGGPFQDVDFSPVQDLSQKWSPYGCWDWLPAWLTPATASGMVQPLGKESQMPLLRCWRSSAHQLYMKTPREQQAAYSRTYSSAVNRRFLKCFLLWIPAN